MPRHSYPKPPAGVPDRTTPTTKTSAPASPGLPPSRRPLPTQTKRRRAHPAIPRKGSTQLQKTEALIAAADEVIKGEATPVAAAIAHGLEASGVSVRELVKSARNAFARRAEFYVEAHMTATTVAAQKGNAEPAQWALERIAEDGERIVDSPKATPTLQPAAVSIGIAIGGIPGGLQAATTANLPMQVNVVEAVDPRELPPQERTEAAVFAELLP